MAKTQAEETYETITKLTDGGMRMADAVHKVASDTGKTEGAVRGNYYNHRRKLDRGSTTPARRSRRRQALSVDDAIEGARQLLQQALGAIDRELEAAKAELDVAQQRYDQLESSVKDRKDELERKIKALS
jgi:hypothetical protein